MQVLEFNLILLAKCEKSFGIFKNIGALTFSFKHMELK